jgi:hypothetical protein
MIKFVKNVKILTLSQGNTKLVGTDKEAFLIWNLPAISTCPFSTSSCRKNCYAMKAQRMYANTRESREESFIESIGSSFVPDMINTINHYLTKGGKKGAKGKKVYFRIHESGDFYNQEYFNKWVVIANNFPEITFLAYTKSVKYVKETKYNIPPNFTIRYSIWEDTKLEERYIAECLNLPTFTAIDKADFANQIAEKEIVGCSGSCETCKSCYKMEVKKIAIEIH